MQVLELVLELIGLLLNLLIDRPERRRSRWSEPPEELRPLPAKRPPVTAQPTATPALSEQVCRSCLWRSSDTCTAMDSPLSGKRCEPVCSGQVVCLAKLELGTDASPFSNQPLAGERSGRESVHPQTSPAEIATTLVEAAIGVGRPGERTLSCPRCGSENVSDCVFCRICGAAVPLA